MLRFTRDRSLILMGFWRGFPSDELVRLHVENVQIVASEGMTCYLDRSKGDRHTLGNTYKCPSLSKLCPVTAFAQCMGYQGIDGVRGLAGHQVGHALTNAAAIHCFIAMEVILNVSFGLE